MADTHVIEIREGAGEPNFVELRPGVVLSPMGVGTQGAWRVLGGGVLGMHAYFYFDGQALFVQSTDPANPATVNGRPVPCAWTPVTAPCTIALAGARLVFRATDEVGTGFSGADDDKTIMQQPMSEPPPSGEDDKTIAGAPPMAPLRAPMQRPYAPGTFAQRPDDESTRLQELDEQGPDSAATRIGPIPTDGPGTRPFASPVRPAAGAPSWPGQVPAPPNMGVTGPHPMGAPGIAPPNDGGLGSTLYQPQVARAPVYAVPPNGPANVPPPGLLNVPPPVQPPPAVQQSGMATLQLKVSHEWNTAAAPRKALFVLMPLAMIGAIWILAGGGEASPGGRPGPATAPDSGTSNSMGGTAATVPSLPPSSFGTTPPITPTYTPVPNTATQPVPPRPAGSTPAPASSTDNRERKAADLVATGGYEQAAQIYDRLAAEHPENPAYREAARILRAKLAAGIR